MSQEPQTYLILSELTLEQVEQAMKCLYQQRKPQNEPLRSLSREEWSMLANLLTALLQEQGASTLH